MKKTIFKISLIIIFLSTIFLTSARVPLVREGVEWGYVNILHNSSLENGEYVSSSKTDYFRIQMRGDTIINDTIYKKVYVYTTETLGNSYTDCNMVMREDNGRIYRRSPVSSNAAGTEIPIYLGDAMKDRKNISKDQLIYDVSEDLVTVYPDNSSLKKEYYLDGVIEINGYPRKVYASKIDNDGSRTDEYNFIEGMGFVACSSDVEQSMGVFMSPLHIFNNSMFSQSISSYLLYERNTSTGEIVFKSPKYDEFADGDPTVNGVGVVTADRSELLSVEHLGGGRMLVKGAQEGALIEAYDTQGRTVATSPTGIVTLPSTGLYIIRSGAQVVKVRF